MQSNYFGLGSHSPDDLQHSPYSNYTASPIRQGPSPSGMSDDNDEQDRKSSLGSIAYQRPPAEIDDADVWCTISYYELNSRIGEPFKVTSHSVTVDGFTDPSNAPDRISLGPLSNVNRNQMTENTRRHIGEGVRFYCDDHQVTVHNMSQSTFFIQSRNMNYKNRHQLTTVSRVASNNSLVIFDFDLFKSVIVSIL